MIRNETHRCSDVDISAPLASLCHPASSSSTTSSAPIFPLTTPVPLLHSLRLSSPSSSSQSLFDLSPTITNLTLFTPSSFASLSRLESLHIHTPSAHISDLALFHSLIPSLESLKHLTIRAYVGHEETFTFIRVLCSETLETLELELVKDDVEAFMMDDGMGTGMGLGDELNGSLDNLGFNHPSIQEQNQRKANTNGNQSYIEGLYLPHLQRLTLHGPSATMLASIIDAPVLESLQFDVRGEDGVFSLGYALAAASGLDLEAEDDGLDGAEGVDNITGTPLYPLLKHLSITSSGDWQGDGDEEFVYVPSDMIRLFVSGGAHEKIETLTLSRWGNVSEVLEKLATSPHPITAVGDKAAKLEGAGDEGVRKGTLPETMKIVTILPSSAASSAMHSSLPIPEYAAASNDALLSAIDSLRRANESLLVNW